MQLDKSLGQIAFEAYVEAAGGKTYDAKPIPTWENLTDVVRDGWETAVIAAWGELEIPLAGGRIPRGSAIERDNKWLYVADASSLRPIIGIALADAQPGHPVRFAVK